MIRNYLILIVLTFFGGIIFSSVSTTLTSAHGGDTSLIHSCIKNNGALQIIGANGTCSNSETPLDWNSQTEPYIPKAEQAPLICPNCNLLGGGEFSDRLSGKDLTDAWLIGVEASGTNFMNTNFTNAVMGGSLGGANFTNVNFTNATLRDANLTGANFSGANVTGVTWINTTCPDGTLSQSQGDTCNGHLIP